MWGWAGAVVVLGNSVSLNMHCIKNNQSNIKATSNMVANRERT